MRSRFWWLIWLAASALPCGAETSTNAVEQKLVDISAHQVEYDPNTKMANATGDVVIVKDDVRITADQARYNQASKDMFADGNVRFTRGSEQFVCESLHYNFNTKAMTMDKSRSTQGPWYAQSDSTRDAGTNRYRAVHGYLTTCDYPEPHWRICYSRIEIYPGDKIIGHDEVMYIGSVPVFYWPYVQKSVTEERMPWTAVPGYSSRFGPYLNLSYIWGLNDHFTLTPHLDLRLKHGVGLGLDTDYKLDGWGNGTLKGYYANDENPGEPTDKLFNKASSQTKPEINPVSVNHVDHNRYNLLWEHKTELPEDLELMILGEKLSDPDVVQTYFQREFRENIQPDSFAALTKTGEHYTADVLVRPNLNEFFSKTERLPEGDLSFVRTPIGRSGVYYENQNRAGYLNREYSSTFTTNLPAPVDYYTARADTFHQLSYPSMAFGWLSVVPRVGGRATYYSRTDTPDHNETVRGVFDPGAEVSFQLSHVYHYQNDALDIHDLRHVATPSVNYSYIARSHNDPPSQLYQFDTINAFDPLAQASPPVRNFPRRTETTRFNPVDFPAFNAIDDIDNEDVFRAGIRNQLQTKRDGLPYDLVDWFMFSDFNINPRSNEVDNVMFNELELRPTKWMALDVENRYDVTANTLVDLNTEMRLLQQDKWSFGIGTRYLHRDSNQAYTDVHYVLNENWAVRAIDRVNMAHFGLDEQEYTVYRDLHCWTSAFTFVYRKQTVGPDDYQFWVVFSLKAFPGLHTTIGQ